MDVNLSEIKDIEWVKPLKTGASIAVAGSGAVGISILGQKVLEKANKNFLRESLFSSFILNGREAREIFKNSELPERGVKLKEVSYSNPKSIKHFKKTMDFLHNKEFVNYFKSLKQTRMSSILDQTAFGFNAFYNPKTKQVACNTKKLAMAMPHEMGHAMNFTDKGLAKILTKARGLQLLAPIALAVGVLRAKKPEGEKSDTMVGKTLDFIKDNCVAITAAAHAPILAEEGLASIRGAKMAKNFMLPEKLKAINTMNKKAWLTYAVAATSVVAATYIGSKLRDLTA